jgi:hypothetical protein
MNPKYGKMAATVLVVLFLTSSALAILPRLMNAYGLGGAFPRPPFEIWIPPPIVTVLVVSVVVLAILIILEITAYLEKKRGKA